MSNTEKKERKNIKPQAIDGYLDAEYIYIIDDQEVLRKYPINNIFSILNYK